MRAFGELAFVVGLGLFGLSFICWKCYIAETAWVVFLLIVSILLILGGGILMIKSKL